MFSRSHMHGVGPPMLVVHWGHDMQYSNTLRVYTSRLANIMDLWLPLRWRRSG